MKNDDKQQLKTMDTKESFATKIMHYGWEVNVRKNLAEK